MSKYFVWLAGNNGPEAQIWYDVPTDGNSKAKYTPIFKIELEGVDAELSLDELILKFKDKVSCGN